MANPPAKQLVAIGLIADRWPRAADGQARLRPEKAAREGSQSRKKQPEAGEPTASRRLARDLLKSHEITPTALAARSERHFACLN
jgi:hypothetical protein